MARIGKKAIQLASGITAEINGGIVKIKGPKGELTQDFGPIPNIILNGSEITAEKKDNSQEQDVFQGTVRAIIANMVEGVTNGYKKTLELNGVGYRVAKKGNDVEFHIGFSHPVLFKVPEGVTVDIEKNLIHVSGINKQLVGEAAANIRKLKVPEPYKGKGIKYIDEHIRRKAGKAGKAAK
ncbi:MAG TPA: 50S ribosomal protein L6 [Patescibacteria group bacterium]|nr:50S ribosomal protein L6 [Patescibacteria group bacterium]